MVGALLGSMTNGPVLLAAVCAWAVTAVASTAIIAQKGGWANAIGIVCVATAIGFGGLLVIGGIGAAIVFGLIVAICGGGR